MARTVSKAPDFSRDNLHEWMATKRQQRMEEYKRHLEELREREAQPFKHKPGEIDHVRNHLANSQTDLKLVACKYICKQQALNLFEYLCIL